MPNPTLFTREKLLKGCLAVALGLTCAFPAQANPTRAEDLVVGSVRDTNGRPVAGAVVRATDAAGTLAGQARTDDIGTFAIHVARPVRALEVRCVHCRPERVTAGVGANVAIIVTRYAALENDRPDTNDLAALPYGRIVDALGLVPFVLLGERGTTVSDRGLGGGRGLVSDNGAALADLATGASALLDFPDRSVQTVALARADDAFRYGPYAAGGIFTLDTFGDVSRAALDGGSASAFAVAPVLASVHPAFGVSSDGGVVARRGDIDIATPFAGGALRTGLTSGSERVELASGALARDLESARAAYATASRRYRTFIDFATSRVVVAESGSTRIDYSSAYSEAGFRLEHPGAVTLAAGLRATAQTASYDRYVPLPNALDGRANSVATYAEAHAGVDHFAIDAGLSSMLVSTKATAGALTWAATQRALLPSLALKDMFGRGFYARAGFSESLSLPAQLESSSQPPQAALPQQERGELLDGALGFDAGGRLKGEAIVYREFTRGGVERRLDGIGASLAWQVSPFIGLRAWSLRTDTASAAGGPYAAALPASRQVLWATFDRRDALRVDAIVHRDAIGGARAVSALDGDVLVPVGYSLAIDLMTSQRDGIRRYGVGLRGRK